MIINYKINSRALLMNTVKVEATLEYTIYLLEWISLTKN